MWKLKIKIFYCLRYLKNIKTDTIVIIHLEKKKIKSCLTFYFL